MAELAVQGFEPGRCSSAPPSSPTTISTLGRLNRADAEASGEDVDADDEGEGDIIGSEDSDDEGETSDTGSVASFINNDGTSDGEQDDGEYGEQDGGMHSDNSGSGDDLALGEEQDGDQDGAWDGQAQFAAEYDIDMAEVFGNGNDSV
ncbi:hypothetical protein FB451DRAFT_1164239 [Mycena latifolia]|nr:hypothetical protein FB451DRAFT_1164239 [Mycena latifolia]